VLLLQTAQHGMYLIKSAAAQPEGLPSGGVRDYPGRSVDVVPIRFFGFVRLVALVAIWALWPGASSACTCGRAAWVVGETRRMRATEDD
jgi:hypothetical protein